MTLDENLSDDWKITKKQYAKRETHFTEDGTTRYCSGRPKGKDELSDTWISVTCGKCIMKRKGEEILKGLKRP